MLRDLARYVRPHRGRVALALVLAVGTSALALPNIDLLGNIVYQITRRDADYAQVMPSVERMLWILHGLIALRQLVSFVRDFTITRLNESIQFQVRLDLFRHLTELSPSFYERRLTGGILAQMLRDAGAVNAFIMAVVVSPLVDVLTFLACVSYAIWVSPSLFAAVAALIPFYVIVFKLTNGRMMFWAKRGRDEFEAMTGHLTERLTGMQEVQLFNAVGRETEKFGGILERFRSVNVRTSLWQGLAMASSALLNAVGPLLVLWMSVRLIRDGRMNVGEFMKFYALLGMLYAPVSRFIEVNSIYRMNVPSLAKVLGFFATPSEVTDRPGATPLPAVRGEVEIDHVDFAYGGGPPTGKLALPVFRGLSFRISPGEKVGIVGPSGCGKSTVIKLLARFVDARSGAVRIDGRDVRDVTLSSLRDAVGVVSQVPFIFKASIRENILYGRPGASFEEVVAAAKAANIHEEILGFPGGYESDAGERGAMLSGGQRQRVAIARVLLRDPRILLLDEATSALDTESERLVQQAVDRLAEGKTCLIVAHRLSTLTTCDRIVVLDEGRVVEEGPMQALLDRGGLFARLWRMQTEAHVARPPDGR